ncbi:hypothetical protein [Archaeoglobus sulfaticallidus]|uniref:hypothetical protein n=1 Tax=Archaeoglobus sulfaticallidus TaxID=1316941 RepID=UPI000A92ACB2|nr:hypothetical protein [Archaeoglobus sulfaticallidus]
MSINGFSAGAILATACPPIATCNTDREKWLTRCEILKVIYHFDSKILFLSILRKRNTVRESFC